MPATPGSRGHHRGGANVARRARPRLGGRSSRERGRSTLLGRRGAAGGAPVVAATLAALLLALVAGLALGADPAGEPAAELAAEAPRSPAHGRLAGALAEYRSIAATGGWGAVPGGPSLEPGELIAPERWEALVARLAITGDLPAEEARDLGLEPPSEPERRGLVSWRRPSGEPSAGDAEPPRLLDDRLAEAVRRFQRRHALADDGVVGPQTLAALNVPVEARVAQLELNLDRWRRLPEELGRRHVLVDLGGQELVALEDGIEVLRMNVVVGTPRTPTPTLASEIAYLVVNPSWYVPASIVRNEIDPKLARDPGYLRRNGYERLPNGLLRQRPGPHNALGQLKFIFPSPYSVYLHDTPSRHLFGLPVRAFSHGCVRIAEPRAFADWLLARQPQLPDLDRLLAAGREHRIDLDEKVPIHLAYWTASVTPEGEVRFHRDVYGRDAEDVP